MTITVALQVRMGYIRLSFCRIDIMRMTANNRYRGILAVLMPFFLPSGGSAGEPGVLFPGKTIEVPVLLLGAAVLLLLGAGSAVTLLVHARRRKQHLRDDEKNLSLYAALDERLVTQSHMASLGEVAAGISHELNQPLTYVKGVLQCTLRDLSTGGYAMEEMKGDLSRAEGQIDYITEIIRQLRSVGRGDLHARRLTDLRKLLDHVTLMFRRKMHIRHIRLRTDIDARLPEILCNPTRLEQLFIQLFQNAIEALEGKGGTITVGIRHEDPEVRIVFSDDGPGIPPGMEKKIFTPFFTTKPSDHAMGLGLYMITRIVEEHHGTVSCRSREGQGAAIIITLPCAEGEGHHGEA